MGTADDVEPGAGSARRAGGAGAAAAGGEVRDALAKMAMVEPEHGEAQAAFVWPRRCRRCRLSWGAIDFDRQKQERLAKLRPSSTQRGGTRPARLRAQARFTGDDVIMLGGVGGGMGGGGMGGGGAGRRHVPGPSVARAVGRRRGGSRRRPCGTTAHWGPAAAAAAADCGRRAAASDDRGAPPPPPPPGGGPKPPGAPPGQWWPGQAERGAGAPTAKMKALH